MDDATENRFVNSAYNIHISLRAHARGKNQQLDGDCLCHQSKGASLRLESPRATICIGRVPWPEGWQNVAPRAAVSPRCNIGQLTDPAIGRITQNELGDTSLGGSYSLVFAVFELPTCARARWWDAPDEGSDGWCICHANVRAREGETCYMRVAALSCI